MGSELNKNVRAYEAKYNLSERNVNVRKETSRDNINSIIVE